MINNKNKRKIRKKKTLTKRKALTKRKTLTKRQKIHGTVLIIIGTISIIWFCVFWFGNKDSYMISTFVKSGNESLSNQCENLISFSDNKIFYVDAVRFGGGIRVVYKDSLKSIQISYKTPLCIAIDENYIYYSIDKTINNSSGIFKMKFSDLSITKLSDDRATEMTIYKDDIYYTLFVLFGERKESGHGDIYKLSKDGVRKTRLTIAPTTYGVLNSSYNIKDGILYYVNGYNYNGKGSPIKKIDLSTQENTLVLKDTKIYACHIKIENDWIYYTVGIDNSKYRGVKKTLYRIKLDGSGNEKIVENISFFTVKNEVIYYVPFDGKIMNPQIHKMNVDGSNKSILEVSIVGKDGIVASGVWFDEGYVYYTGWIKNVTDSNVSLCRVKEDGSDFQIVFPLKKE